MAQVVYLSCAGLAFACAVFLLRGYRRGRARLLLWSGLCFAGLTANNALVFVDVVVVPDVSLFTLRAVTGLLSVTVLLVGLLWEES